MRVSAFPILSPLQRRRIISRLCEVLVSPTLSQSTNTHSFPRADVYIDGRPVRVYSGTWELTDTTVFVAGPSADVPALTRAAILASLAVVYGVDTVPRVMAAVQQAFATVVAEGVGLDHPYIVSTRAPKQMAFSPTLTEFAAKLDNQWVRPSGTLMAEVPKTWIIMDC